MRAVLPVYALLAVLSLGTASLIPQGAGARAVSAGEAPLYIYQQLIGPHDGRSCPSWPVCSLYARQAIAAHGVLLGSWLMLDRLIHEADDLRRGPWLLANDGERLYDPLARNDFWLRTDTHATPREQDL